MHKYKEYLKDLWFDGYLLLFVCVFLCFVCLLVLFVYH
jgi:hypothetical protein